MIVATEIGKGCRVEGPHGPVACGSEHPCGDDGVCECGCSAYEDCCDTYSTWQQEQHEASALKHPKRKVGE